MFRSQKPQPFILTRTYGQVYTASQECIFDLPAPKKDISDVFYSNGSKPSYYHIKDDVTGKRKFADAFSQVGFDKVEIRELKKESVERKKLVTQLFEALILTIWKASMIWARSLWRLCAKWLSLVEASIQLSAPFLGKAFPRGSV